MVELVPSLLRQELAALAENDERESMVEDSGNQEILHLKLIACTTLRVVQRSLGERL